MAKRSAKPRFIPVDDRDLEPAHRWHRPLQAPGTTQVDFEERVDFRRLHRYRLARTRQALARSGLGAVLCFDQHNIRYVSSLLPNVPTIAEQGVPGFDYTLWVGLWGPAGMPADIANKINKDVNAALASPDLRERLTRLGTEPGNMTIPEFTEYVRKEVEDTQRVLKAAGIKPQ